jgi:diketogulonate reductase-like aldo/keto reductase
MDTVDLFLIHWPAKGKYLETWRALEKLYADGKVRAIGVSNFLVHHLQDVVKGGSVPPAVNQVEFHPFLVQKDILAYDARMKIQPEAWAPLTRTRSFDNPLIVSLSRKYGRTPAQIILRWDLQVGVVTIPKSVHRERIEENSRVFDFTLEQADVDALSALDTGTRIGPNPDTIDF